MTSCGTIVCRLVTRLCVLLLEQEELLSLHVLHLGLFLALFCSSTWCLGCLSLSYLVVLSSILLRGGARGEVLDANRRVERAPDGVICRASCKLMILQQYLVHEFLPRALGVVVVLYVARTDIVNGVHLLLGGAYRRCVEVERLFYLVSGR